VANEAVPVTVPVNDPVNDPVVYDAVKLLILDVKALNDDVVTSELVLTIGTGKFDRPLPSP
jgi:hypothetical protein